MRVNFVVDSVRIAGTETLREPLVWPAWFAIDGHTIAGLLGAPNPVVHAPGPHPASKAASWDLYPGLQGMAPRTAKDLPDALVKAVANSSSGKFHPAIGLGLLLSEGGANHNDTWAAYHELVAQLHGLALAFAAAASGLEGLLAAFGGFATASDAAAMASPKLWEKLHHGLDPASLKDHPSARLAAAMAAFQPLAQVLAERLPGTHPTPSQTVAPQPKPPEAATDAAPPTSAIRDALLGREVVLSRDVLLGREVASRELLGLRLPQITAAQPKPAQPVQPPVQPEPAISEAIRGPTLRQPLGARLTETLRGGGLTIPGLQPVRPTLAKLAEGTVVAGLVQIWPVQSLPSNTKLAIRQRLPARGITRASLTLSGSIHRED